MLNMSYCALKRGKKVMFSVEKVKLDQESDVFGREGEIGSRK